jgi:FMN reductase
MIPVTVIVGNPKPNSRTRRVAVSTTQALCRSLAVAGSSVGPPNLIDLAEATADLVGQGERPDRLDEMLRMVRLPGGLLVVASPTFKAAYTGLLKLFFDLLPQAALRGVVAVPLMTAASAANRTVVEHLLRPLLVEVGARVPTPGLCVMESEFETLDQRLAGWLTTAVPALSAALAAPSAPLGRPSGALAAPVSPRFPLRSSAEVG